MILIDTHVVLWLALAPQRLSSNARAAVRAARRAADPLAISDVTLWEIAFAVRKKRVPLHTGLDAFLQEIEGRFQVLPITGPTAESATGLASPFPRDPADRIIAATALVRGLPLITADKAIRRSGAIRTIW